MFYKTKDAVISEIRTKHIPAMWSPRSIFNFKPLKTKFIYILLCLIAYRAVITLHFGYKNQSLKVL
jgi:hypothetical protein